MSKCWYIAGLVLIFSVLCPYIFISKTEKELQKELADKGQQIIELLKERIDAQREIAELKDTIRSLNKQISSPGVNKKCIEGLECALVVKDYEREVEKLEDDIKLLQGQVNANTKEFATCQELLDDCNTRNHISNERSSDRFYYIIIFGMLTLLCGGCCCCGFLNGMEKHKYERERETERERYQQEQARRIQHEQQLQAIKAKQKQPQSKVISG